jgi:hypothetical protein
MWAHGFMGGCVGPLLQPPVSAAVRSVLLSGLYSLLKPSSSLRFVGPWLHGCGVMNGWVGG